MCTQISMVGSPSVLVGSDDSQPISDIVLLEVFLCQVFKIPEAEQKHSNPSSFQGLLWCV